MIKKIQIYITISIISLCSLLPSFAMDQDQEVINRITKKIRKYETKASDLRRLLENFHLRQNNEIIIPVKSIDKQPNFIKRPSKKVPPSKVVKNPVQASLEMRHLSVGQLESLDHQEIIQNSNTNIIQQDQTTPIRINNNRSLIKNIEIITISVAREHLKDLSKNNTLEAIGVSLGYGPDISSPGGTSTGKVAVSNFINHGSNSRNPKIFKMYKESLKKGKIPFPSLYIEDKDN